MFNKDFADQIHGGDEEEKDEFAPQMLMENGQSLTAKDYLAGVSKSLEKDLHKEMLLEQRNKLMQIRVHDSESRKYEMTNTGFDFDLVEKKYKPKQIEKQDQQAKQRDYSDFKRGQKAIQNCIACFLN